jgi:hypothetical protein
MSTNQIPRIKQEIFNAISMGCPRVPVTDDAPILKCTTGAEKRLASWAPAQYLTNCVRRID